jgi:hypothetical protein
VDFLAGSTVQENVTEGLYIVGFGYSNDALLRTISNATSQYSSDNYGQYHYAALFGRLNYNYENKYVVNLTGRRDGSSNFGPGHQFGNFASIGAAWIFTEENWMKNNLAFLSFGKFRGSYGTTGNDGPPYAYLTRWSSNGLLPYSGIQPLEPTQHANPNYEWQVNKKLEGAIDLGFFKDRLNLSVVYYRNRVGNQLVPYPTPEFTGFTSVTANSPALVQNDGWEFSSNITILKNKKLRWTFNVNGAINRNRLLAYPNLSLSPYANVYVIGQSLNNIKLLHSTGVDPQTGQYTFKDKNHDGVINPNPGINSDLCNFNLSPKFTGGFGTALSYKRLQLSLFFNVIKQIGINALSNLYPGSLKNMPTSVLARWQKPGDITNVARFTTEPTTSDENFSISDGTYTDASFIRLQNVSLTYSLAESLTKKMGISGSNLFVHAENLFVITKYKGIDPETQNFGGMPPARVIVGGISFNF